MTNQEINSAVARKLGWMKLDKPDYSLSHPHYWKNEKGGLDELKDWSISVASAWEIVEKAKLHLIPTDKGWFCSSGEVIEEGDGHEIYHPGYCVTRDLCGCGFCAIADTAPLAICQAFLKLP